MGQLLGIIEQSRAENVEEAGESPLDARGQG
jgi:hypothetical protein